MKPDFLCIGAQKAATSWLYQQMAKHPQIWVPPVKELNYFNNTSSTLYKRLFSKHWLDRNWRILFKQQIMRPFFNGKKINQFKWHLKYFFFPRNFHWYISLFPDTPGELKGEFSVAYAVLGDKVISQIAKLLPDLKFIYLLRNPILRTWSQAKMNLGKHKGYNLDELPDEKFYEHFDNPYVKPHSDYLTNLTTLKKYYSPEQTFIGFFDEIREKPAHFLEKLFTFLEVDFPAEIYKKGLTRKIHVGIEKEPPQKFLTYLAGMYFDQITEVHQTFNNIYTQGWLDFAKQYLKRS
jgi:hypothetical protein